MKKSIIILMAAIMCLSFASCSKSAPVPDTPVPESEDAGDDETKVSYYFKSKENTAYVFEGSEDKYSDWIFFYDYIGDDKVQKRTIAPVITGTEVLTFSDGKMAMTNGMRYVSDHIDRRNYHDNADVVLLKEPLSLGASWVRSVVEDPSVETKVTGVDVEVTVPYGTFKALEVTTVYEEGVNKEICYYAKDIGLIKTISVSGGEEMVSELSEIREGYGLPDIALVFYPNSAKDGIEYDIAYIVYSTNANLSELYAQAARQFLSDKLDVTLNENIKINSIAEKEDYSSVTVDFNNYALEEMNKITDPKMKELVLRCAANYFGYLYKTDDVIFTIDSKAYETVAVNVSDASPAE